MRVTRFIFVCFTLQNKSSEELVKTLRENNACFSCLQLGHRSVDCRLKEKCLVTGCENFHHKNLHDSYVKGLILHTGNVMGAGELNEVMSKSFLLPIMPIKTSHEELDLVNVMWDSAASLSLITFKMAEKLGLKGKRTHLSIVTAGGTVEEMKSFKYVVWLCDQEERKVPFTVYGIQAISTPLTEILLNKVIHLFPGIVEEDVKRLSGEVDVLIGMDYAAFHPQMLKNVDHLVLYGNRFGKCLGGSHTALKENSEKLCTSVYVHHVGAKVISDFLEIESLGVNCVPRCGG